MSEQREVPKGRRLGAIMFTDVIGYSRMSSADEETTLALLKQYRSLLKESVRVHDGRIVKTLGDGFLVEFVSAVEAVDCAVETQKAIFRFNATRPEGLKMQMRIGIHVGDVVHSDGDVMGDAVNVASRVEPLAEPGGVCITRQVVDQIQGKVRWQVSSMGMRSLKNLPEPVETFSVSPDLATPASQASNTRRIAILPFSNLSPDPNDKYLADGMTEELISTVSRIGELSVISRSSAIRYRDTSLPMNQVGRELGVGAILEGSVRKAGNKVRISAQLIEVDSDKYVWSQSYDRDLTDILGVEGEIAQQVAEGLKVQLVSGQRSLLERKLTSNPKAYTLYLKGRFYWNERTEEGVKRAAEYFEQALRVDPKFAKAFSGLADCYTILADYGWMVPSTAGQLAKENATKALAIDDSLAEAHASLGLISMNHYWDFALAEKELRRAIELNPNYVPAYHWYGVLLSDSRRYEDAYRTMRQAAELDPYSPILMQSMGVALLGMGRTDDAMDKFAKVEEENPGLPSIQYWIAVANICKSRYSDAVDAAKKEVEVNKDAEDSRLDLAFAHVTAGDLDAARKIVEDVLAKKGVYVPPASMGVVLLGLGREDEAFRWFDKAFAEHDVGLLYFRSVPAYSRYWSHPRWLEIDKKMGFPGGLS